MINGDEKRGKVVDSISYVIKTNVNFLTNVLIHPSNS